jgi:2-dehydro-3-deoxyphosphooctonate aldolase (KDO 8-P synthase)
MAIDMTALYDIPKLKYSNTGNFVLIAGPCAIENAHTPFEIAAELVRLSDKWTVPLLFKGSYRKANRSRKDSFTGIGDEAALEVLAEIGHRFDLPVVTDIHSESEAKLAAEFVDVLQIPAFLCRQTSLLEAAAKTGKWVNIKKGQFLSAEAMTYAVDKVRQAGNNNVLITERGTTFGYQDLIVDFRGFPIMRSMAPLILDCTHSLQQPNQRTGVTGGRPDLIETIARAGVAAGLDGLFIETHPRPEEAKSDGANMLPLSALEQLLSSTLAIHKALST